VTISVTSPDQNPTAVSSAELRHAIGHFATGVTVVTSRGPDQEPIGTTANAVTSLSLEPPLVLVCFDHGSATLEAIRGRGAFAINVLADDQRQLSANFARRGADAAWAGVAHRQGPTGIPWLDGALATLDCTVEDRLTGGDHEIILGRVRDVHTSAADVAPLLFWRGAYASLGNR